MVESTHIAFLDESGDHSLQHIDKQFPVFALAAAIFERDYYLNDASPRIDELKDTYWGHNNVIFHFIDIRKQKKEFRILRDPYTGQCFSEDLNALIKELDFTVISSGIHKIDFGNQYIRPSSPYDLTLEFIMERLYYFFKGTDCTCTLAAESRGDKEDMNLSHTFRHLMENGNQFIKPEDFQNHISDLKFLPKIQNENGSQIADLVVYPIARKILGRANEYNPYELIKPKFYARNNGDFWGYGLKVFPQQTYERVKCEAE